jgi:hypothetical protein
MAGNALSPVWMNFVEESEALAGISTSNKERPGYLRHLEAAQIVAGAKRLIEPCFINGILSNRSGEWYRGGTESGHRGRVPDGSLVKSFVSIWFEEAEVGLKNIRGLPEVERSAFAWTMHAKLACISPFKQANGRTARLMLNYFRMLLKLPVEIISNKEAENYYAMIEQHRTEQFLPF